MNTLRLLTIEGIVADAERARELLDRSSAAATALSPYIGYAATAEIAKEAVKTGKSIRQVVLAKGLLAEKRLDEILSVEKMTKGGVTGRMREAEKAGEAIGKAGVAGKTRGAGHSSMAGRPGKTAVQARKKRPR